MRSDHTRRALATAFLSLRVRNFRLFTVGQVVSVSGTWMMVVAQDWLVLSMTRDSGTALGLVTALQFTPVLLLTLHGGRLADRFDKRRLLTAANLASALLALLLGALILAGRAQLWHVCLCALGLGVVNAVEAPTRIAFVSEMVGAELLPNASALSAAYFNTARIVGPALAGLLLGVFGTGAVMLLNAVSYLATVAALWRMRPEELHRAESTPESVRVVDGLRYLSPRRDLVMPLALLVIIGTFGFNFQLTLPLIAKTEFHADPGSFGLLTVALAVGSLCAAFATTARRGRPSARTVLVAALAFGALEAAAGCAPTFAAAVVLLVPTGFATVWFAQATNHRVQLGTDPRYRGRVMAVYTLILQGSTPLGALFVGRLAEEAGARSGLWVGGLASLAAGLAAVAVERGRRGRGTAEPDPHETGRRRRTSATR